MVPRSRWSSVRRPWDVICLLAGMLGLTLSGVASLAPGGRSAADGALVVATLSLSLGVVGLGALALRRQRRSRGLVLAQGRMRGLTWAAMALLLAAAFLSIIWPVATRLAWVSMALGLVCMAGAAWLGLRLACDGLPAGFRRAQRAFAEGDTEQALALLDDLVDSSPNFCGADQLRAEVHRARGEGGLALEASQRLIDTHPELYYGYAERGLALLDAGRAAEALGALRRGVEAAPHLAEAHFNLGMAAAEAGESEDTADAMSQALRLGLRDQVTELIARYRLHLALDQMGEIEPAARELRRMRRMQRVLGEWRRALSDGDLPKERRRADMALSARIERLIHS